MPSLGNLIPILSVSEFKELQFQPGGDEWINPTIVRDTSTASILISRDGHGHYNLQCVSPNLFLMEQSPSPFEGLRRLFAGIFERAPYETYNHLRSCRSLSVEDRIQETEIGPFRLVRNGLESSQWAGNCGVPLMMYDHPHTFSIHMFVASLPIYPLIQDKAVMVRGDPVLIFQESNLEEVVGEVYDWIHNLRKSSRIFIPTQAKDPESDIKSWMDFLLEGV